LRDPVERCLGVDRPLYDLSHIPDSVLTDELQSRGWTVSR
jgi:hypothetical protein